MVSAERGAEFLSRRPKRVDARRNYEKLICAARETFAEDGVSASLEEIARRAQVGIGTLYRDFPTRQDLFESVYVEEVAGLCRTADDLAELPPFEALTSWLHRFVCYVGTKKALLDAMNHDADLFLHCRAAIDTAGGPLLRRAQDAGVARDDIIFDDVLRLVGGIAMFYAPEPGQLERVLGMAFDGIRSQPPRPLDH